MSGRTDIYNDMSAVASLPEVLREVLRQHGLTVTFKEVERVSFCGVIFLGKDPLVFLPRSIDTSELNETGILKVISDLVRSIDLYARTSKTRVNARDREDRVLGDIYLKLVLDITDDFASNGIYTKKSEKRVLNSGNVDWKRTITKSSIFLREDDQPLYLDLWGRKTRHSADSEVSRIHAEVLRELFANLPWLEAGGKHVQAHSILGDIPPPSGNIEKQITELKREQGLLYSDRGLWLVSSLIDYLSMRSGRVESPLVMGVNRFHVAWEAMLHAVLPHTIDVNSKLPVPAYTLDDGSVSVAARTSQRLDIVIHPAGTKKLAIVDAKYYDAQSVSKAPRWHDLVKQFFYLKALRTVYDDSFSISNCFIFPGQSGPLKQISMVDRQSEGVSNDDFGNIHCFYICPSKVLSFYAGRQLMGSMEKELLEVGMDSLPTTQVMEL